MESARTPTAEYDAAALRIADRIRSSLDLEDVLQYTVDELGKATGASRSLMQLAPDDSGRALLVEWDRGDTRPLGIVPPTVVARRLLAAGETVVVETLDDADHEIRGYLESVGSVSAVALPIRWRSGVLAVVGFEDSVPREWRSEALPLLERLEGQIGAALVQADLYVRQQQALEQLRDLDRMRDELLANVSHELRTPLTAVIGSIKTLRRLDGSLAPHDREQLLAAMDEQADRLFNLTDDILQLARLTRGKQRLRREPVSVGEIVAAARRGAQLPAGREIATAIEDDVVVNADAGRMVQVLANLIQNAARHGSGRITVRCFREDEHAVIWVGDEGAGVPASYEEEMFTAFAHASDRSDSTGLGLSIARAIVESHGGRLTYRAATDGETHQFVVTLPAVSGRE